MSRSKGQGKSIGESEKNYCQKSKEKLESEHNNNTKITEIFYFTPFEVD